jgi:hypothetical protein
MPVAPMTAATAKGGRLRALSLEDKELAMVIARRWLSVRMLWHSRCVSGAKSHRQLEATKQWPVDANESQEDDAKGVLRSNSNLCGPKVQMQGQRAGAQRQVRLAAKQSSD